MPNRVSLIVLAGFFGALAFGCSGVMPPDQPNVISTSPSPGASPATTAAAFRADVVPILQQHCAACHTAGGGGANAVQMFDAEGQPNHPVISQRIGNMINAIRTGRMPLGRPNSVPESQIRTLEAWQKAGAPND